jgi:hypothetical protein
VNGPFKIDEAGDFVQSEMDTLRIIEATNDKQTGD